jgi:hydroxyethylthiazole kinase-like uncharacterized protein yjeF
VTPPGDRGRAVATGVDVAEVARIARLLERRPRFAEKLFSPEEVEYCAGRPERLAVRWAAKEAVRKVHGSLGLPLPLYPQISVRHRPGGAPEALVLGHPVPGLEISLTHDAGVAVAVAVMTASVLPLPVPDQVALPARPPAGHKGTFGTVLVVAGSPQFPGAAELACRGALRGGAGKVRSVVAMGDPAAGFPPEVIRVPLPVDSGHYLASALAQQLTEAAGDVVVVGPGLGGAEGVDELVATVLGSASAGLVVDADALNAMSRAPRLRSQLPPRSVLTPHPLEAARLLGTTAAAIQADREGAARELAAGLSAVVVLKGAGSVVAEPSGELWRDAHATSALAIGGAGDVLAGLIGALLAQGHGPAEAARAGVFLHAAAGARLAELRGRSGLLASEVADQLVETQEAARRWLEDRAQH